MFYWLLNVSSAFLLSVYLSREQNSVGFLSFIPNVICCELFSCTRLLSFPFVYLLLHTLSLFTKLVIIWDYAVFRGWIGTLGLIFYLVTERLGYFFSSFILIQKKKEMLQSMNNLSPWILKNIFEYFMVQASLFYVSFPKAGEVQGIIIWTQSVMSFPRALWWWESHL